MAATGTEFDELLDHLERSGALARGEAARIVADVLAYFSESADAFVRRRHRELQRSGLENRATFARIAEELARRRVAPPALSERQIRRIVYG
jgi:hypothetical protein